MNETSKASREIILKIISGQIKTKNQLEKEKKKQSKKYSFPRILKNSDVLSNAYEDERELIVGILRKRPTRTISGVSVVAVMTQPYKCPHETAPCLYCPGGPKDREIGTPQSYTGLEPAALRAIQNNYDPFEQTKSRLDQLTAIGHPISKIDLIIMGGTFFAHPINYQKDYIKGCIDAVINKRTKNLEESIKIAEKSPNRLIGVTLETRPDCCSIQDLDRALDWGVTRIEIGVQTLNDEIFKYVKRGHGINEVINAFQVLRDHSFKVTAHMMPFLPNSTPEIDFEVFKILFTDERFIPDEIKIYPTLVVEGTELYKLWKNKDYIAPTNEDVIDFIVKIKEIVPKHVRIKRILRDIPAYKILAGPKKSNLRELVWEKANNLNIKCKCLRCREVGHLYNKFKISPKIENIKMTTTKYDASKGIEYFLAFEDIVQDIIIGFLRLRFPSEKVTRPEIIRNKTSLVRELHVYGPEMELGQFKSMAWQHQGYGARLLEEAERISCEELDCKKIMVISGIGAREYYLNHNYKLDGPFVSKLIKN
ncbi:MAG: tRNA uridine(34) 5-carboxymethylaminomethyl modification radical SAM/GNAT enzyme Elp3 [Candidatus Lokiarchaeota archaeon]|nr:tRNA uridine(34) 5-carboxymethylaminomethyl modification radical SAM/GNAT enzyme Elp3 [Candidatus Lokiarchaeota archaeon]